MAGLVKGVVKKRVAGDKPSPVSAALAAAVVGAAVAVLTYRVIRS